MNKKGLPPPSDDYAGYTDDVIVRVDKNDMEYSHGYYLFAHEYWYVYDRHTGSKERYDSVYEWWPRPKPGTGVKPNG